MSIQVSADAGQTADIRVLDNGLTLAMETIPYVRSATVGVWVRAGSANERPDEAGISHLVEHLLFKGTERRTARMIVEEIEGRGGQINAFTSREYTCVYAKVLEDDIALAIDVLADIVQHTQFIDLEKERNVILEEISSAEEIPEDYIHDAFTMRLWPGHAMGRPVAGFQETVRNIGFDDVSRYHREWYRPGNTIVSIAGRIDLDRTAALIEERFGGANDGPAPEAPPAPIPGRTAEAIVRPQANQSHLCFGFPGARCTDDNRFAMELLSSVLGGASTSRLFEKVREDEGLAYSIYTFNYAYPTAGMFGVYAAIAPENVERAADICFQELRDILDGNLNENELTTNRELLKGGLLMALESTFNRMARMAKSLMYHGRIVPVDEVVNRIGRVGRDEVHQAAAQVFQRDACTLLVLGPEDIDAGALVRL